MNCRICGCSLDFPDWKGSEHIDLGYCYDDFVWKFKRSPGVRDYSYPARIYVCSIQYSEEEYTQFCNVRGRKTVDEVAQIQFAGTE